MRCPTLNIWGILRKRLSVEGEPGDVDIAGGLEDARRDLRHAASVLHHQVGREGCVELLVNAVVQ